MNDAYRHSIEELVTRYDLEPDLRDVYVEGERDRLFFKWAFDRLGLRRPVVYSVNSKVNVPQNLLLQYGVSGNRGRIIAMCSELEKAIEKVPQNVIGVVDRDYDHFVNGPSASTILLQTDFSCLECYALDAKVLEQFCLLYLGVDVVRDRFEEIFEVLTELFLLRAAKISLGNAPWVSVFTKLCSVEREKIIFRRKEFVDRLVNASRGKLDKEQLEARVAQFRARLDPDFKHSVNGHDLVQALSWFAHRLGVDAAIYQAAPLQRALMASVDIDGLEVVPLFRAIKKWAA